MRIVVKILLMGLVAAFAGCGSHDSKEVQNGERNARNRAVVDDGRACAPGAAVNCDNPANQTVTAVDVATAKTQQVTRDVNRTAEHVQYEVQQTAGDAAQLSNDANRAVNGAERDLNNLKNAFR